jgi:hypothetical protein
VKQLTGGCLHGVRTDRGGAHVARDEARVGTIALPENVAERASASRNVRRGRAVRIEPVLGRQLVGGASAGADAPGGIVERAMEEDDGGLGAGARQRIGRGQGDAHDNRGRCNREQRRQRLDRTAIKR